MIENIQNSLKNAQTALGDLLSNKDALYQIEAAANILIDSFESGYRVFSCGNGGSMCDAMHFAEELTGRYRLNRRAYPAVAISDPSHLSCVANDFGYDFVFLAILKDMETKGIALLRLAPAAPAQMF